MSISKEKKNKVSQNVDNVVSPSPGYFISDSALWLNNEYRKQTKSQVLQSLAKLLHFIHKTGRHYGQFAANTNLFIGEKFLLGLFRMVEASRTNAFLRIIQCTALTTSMGTKSSFPCIYFCPCCLGKSTVTSFVSKTVPGRQSWMSHGSHSNSSFPKTAVHKSFTHQFWDSLSYIWQFSRQRQRWAVKSEKLQNKLQVQGLTTSFPCSPNNWWGFVFLHS